MDVQALRSHIEQKFGEAKLDRSPFPHLVIEDFFPDQIYRAILRENPFNANRGKEWITKAEARNLKTATPYFARKQINFHTGDYFEATPEGRELWGLMKSCFLGDSWFPSLVLDKYREYFVIRFGDLVDDAHFFDHFKQELFLQRHEPGYYIGPHTDVPSRVFTCIFSFAECDGFDAFGTELCAHRDPLVRCWGNNHYTPEEFVVKKVAPYKPNNFLLFFKTRQSFHSVRAIDDTVPNQRYGMQFQFYEPHAGLFRDLSAPDLMVTRHAKQEGRVKQLISMMVR